VYYPQLLRVTEISNRILLKQIEPPVSQEQKSRSKRTAKLLK